MAYTTPLTATPSTALTYSQWNASVRDNFAETAVAKASAAGQIFVSTAANALAARTPGSNYSAGTDTTASATFTDLAGGAGPAVTVTTGATAFVIVGSRMSNATAGERCFMGYGVTGASTNAASIDRAVAFTSSASNANGSASYVTHETGLTAGSNVFTAKYSTTAGTGSFSNRRLAVIPL